MMMQMQCRSIISSHTATELAKESARTILYEAMKLDRFLLDRAP